MTLLGTSGATEGTVLACSISDDHERVLLTIYGGSGVELLVYELQEEELSISASIPKALYVTESDDRVFIYSSSGVFCTQPIYSAEELKMMAASVLAAHEGDEGAE